MSHSYIDPKNDYYNVNDDSDTPQKKIDPVAQLKWLNTPQVYGGWGLFHNQPAQMFAKDEEEEKQRKPENENDLGIPKPKNRKTEKIEKKINKKISGLIKKNDIKDRNARILELKKSLADLESIRNDNTNTYVFKKARKNPNNKVPETVRTGNSEITIYTDNFSKVIHELRHAGQIARKEFDIDIAGNLISGTFGVSKEIDAYIAQYAYDGYLLYLPSFETMSQEKLQSGLKTGVDENGNPTLKYDVRLLQEKLLDINLINADFINNEMYDLKGLNQTPVYPPPGIDLEYWNNN